MPVNLSRGGMELGALVMAMAAFIWGTVTVFAAASNVDPIVFVALRVLFGSTILLLLLGGLYRAMQASRDPVVLASGIMLAVNWILLFTAVTRAPIPVVVPLYYIGPLLASTLAAVSLGEKPGALGIAGLAAGYTGGVLLVASEGLGGEHSFQGIVLAVASGVAYGLLGFTSKVAVSRRGVDPMVLVQSQLLVSAVILAPALWLSGSEMTVRTLAVGAIAGVVHTALALYLWFTALMLIPMYLASVLSYLDPLVATVLAWTVLGQEPAALTLLGAMLVVAGGVLAGVDASRGRS